MIKINWQNKTNVENFKWIELNRDFNLPYGRIDNENPFKPTPHISLKKSDIIGLALGDIMISSDKKETILWCYYHEGFYPLLYRDDTFFKDNMTLLFEDVTQQIIRDEKIKELLQ
jgi:hypothetical protein